MIDIVSHQRSGTHYLAKLLWLNFETGREKYDELHYSHSRVPTTPYVHIHRPAFPVMLSFWRMRERFGIGDVSFSDFIRTSLPQLPKIGEAWVAFNGGQLLGSAPVRPYAGTLLERWFEYVSLFFRGATINIAYSDAVDRPLDTVLRVEKLGYKRRGEFQPVVGRVGYWSLNEQDPCVTEADAVLIERYETLLRSTL